jgi:hypothetical protein
MAPEGVPGFSDMKEEDKEEIRDFISTSPRPELPPPMLMEQQSALEAYSFCEYTAYGVPSSPSPVEGAAQAADVEGAGGVPRCMACEGYMTMHSCGGGDVKATEEAAAQVEGAGGGAVKATTDEAAAQDAAVAQAAAAQAAAEAAVAQAAAVRRRERRTEFLARYDAAQKRRKRDHE